MSVGEAISRGAKDLDDRQIENPRQEAIWLLEFVLDSPAGQLPSRLRETLTEPHVEQFQTLIQRRAQRVPLQHLIGSWPFLELVLRVDGRALVPRPETEDLVLLARERLDESESGLVIDVGTGTGCIAVSLAASHTGLRVLATDLDPAALELARENLELLGLEERVSLACCDLLPPPPLGQEPVMIIANLPYVTEGEWQNLDPEVRDHDPRNALVAAEEGLAEVRRLCALAPDRLAPGGWLLAEMSPGQVPVIAGELEQGRWARVEVHEDRYRRRRFIAARAAT